MNGSSVNVVNAVRGHASAVRTATVADVGAAAGLAARYVRDVHVGSSFCARAIKISADKGWARAAWVGSEALGAVGEARSQDGRQWTRGVEAVLRPPDGAAGLVAPCAVLSRSALGRERLWLYHSLESADGRRTIEVAAREGFDGPFIGGTATVFGFGSELAPTEPNVVRFADFSLLFVTQRAGKSAAQAYPGVAVGVAPAALGLPAPNP